MSVVRIALVGCGRLAELGYVPAVALTSRVALAAVADPDRGRRDRTAAGTGVPAFADLGALLHGCGTGAASQVDAVVLASPAAAHLADAERAVAHGLPVLVEKPPAPDVEGAASLAALGPLVRVGFNRRYDPGVRRVRNRASEAAIGRPGTGGDGTELSTRGIEIEAHMAYRRASWAAHTVHDDILADLGPHLVDLVRWIGSAEIVDVTARRLSNNRAELELTLTNGRATVTAAVDRYHAEQLVVRDGAGRVVGQHRTGGPVAAVAGRVSAVAARSLGRQRPHPLVASLGAQLSDLADFVGLIGGGGEPAGTDRGTDSGTAIDLGTATDLGTTADGLAVMAVLDTARTSATRGGQPVSVAETLERVSC